MVLNFFFFAFLLIFTPGEYPGLYPINLSRDFRSFLLLGIGLAGSLLLYASWRLAIRLTQVSDGLRDRLLPTVFISGVICATFVYGAGSIIQKIFLRQHNSVVLLQLTLQWFFLCIYFLSAFLVIIHSKLKRYEWKTIFFLLPLIPSWAVRISGRQESQFLIECIFLLFFAGLLFFLDLDSGDALTDKK